MVYGIMGIAGKRAEVNQTKIFHKIRRDWTIKLKCRSKFLPHNGRNLPSPQTLTEYIEFGIFKNNIMEKKILTQNQKSSIIFDLNFKKRVKHKFAFT